MFLGTVAAKADVEISPESLNQVKSATIFLKVEINGTRRESRRTVYATGFLAKVVGDTGYIFARSEPFLPFDAFTWIDECVAIFSSGAKNETTLTAEVLAPDPYSTFTLLKVTGVPRSARPIEPVNLADVTETMRVYLLGFPLGRRFAQGTRNPAITISKGSVSAILRNQDDQVTSLRLDGDVNRGTEGGPVVDARGKLVGVVGGRVPNSGIGAAYPPGVVADLFDGTIGGARVRTRKVENGTAIVDIEASRLDPLDRLKTVTFHYLPESVVKERPRQSEDGWTPLQGAQKVDLRLGKTSAS